MSDVTISRNGPVAVLTLDAPARRNVLSAELVGALTEAYDEVERDQAVRCVVLTGAGSAFCAGCLLGETWDAGAALGLGLVKSVHPAGEVVPAAIELGMRLGGLFREYVHRLTSTLRSAAGGTPYAEVLAEETSSQQWSTRPEFLDGVRAIRARVQR